MASAGDRLRLVAAHLDQADRRLRAARHLLASGDHEDAVSRAYHAAFHAMTAALASRDLESKTHAGARRLFALHFISSGLAPLDVGRAIEALQRDRQSSDYDPTPLLSREDAESAVASAERVIAAIRELLGMARGSGDFVG